MVLRQCRQTTPQFSQDQTQATFDCGEDRPVYLKQIDGQLMLDHIRAIHTFGDGIIEAQGVYAGWPPYDD